MLIKKPNFQLINNWTNEEKITYLAYSSRFLIVVLQYAANRIIPDHDAQVFTYPEPLNKTGCDKIVDHVLGGFLRWDGQYFMHIAKYGYTFENTLAFFPLYPLSVGFIGKLISQIVGEVHLDSIILILFIMVNIYIFKESTVTLYKLTEMLFNKKFAYDSAILFCFSPASIFFVAPYTECLFSYLTFWCILNCLQIYEKYSKTNNEFGVRDFIFILPVALSTITRSNGILNIGFLTYTFISVYKKKLKLQAQKNCLYSISTLKFGFVMLMAILDCLIPFIAFQYYCLITFCQDFYTDLPEEIISHAAKNNYILPGTFTLNNQKWCSSWLPLAYSYVQDHYWNVGFLRYYEFKQLPNFLLAFPILCTLLYSSIRHLYVNLVLRKYYNIFTMENPNRIRKHKVHYSPVDLYQPKLMVFHVHTLFLSLFCTFFIHIQVSTRLLCSGSPVFYWVCSNHLNLLKLPSKSDTLIEMVLRIYFISYFVVGIFLFCNFLPWT